MPLDQRAILERARSQLALGTVESLRYAALECRLLMEELTYEKLRAYAELLPESELNKWQPREAVKMLLAIDPNADQGIKVEISPVPTPDGRELSKEDYERMEWVPLGEHHALSLKWLKNYHKVGALLHAPKASESSTMPIEKQRQLLADVLDELAKAAGSSLRSIVFKGGLVFQCIGCNRQVLANVMNLMKGAIALCPNDDCQFEYEISQHESGEEPSGVRPTGAVVACAKCAHTIHVPKRRLKAGHQFECGKCSTQYRLGEPSWPLMIRNSE